MPQRITKPKDATTPVEIKVNYARITEPTPELIKKVKELTEQGAILKDMSGQLGMPLDRLRRWIKRGEREEGDSPYAILYSAYCEAKSTLSIKLFQSTIELARQKCDSRTMLELYNQVNKRDELTEEDSAPATNTAMKSILDQIR